MHECPLCGEVCDCDLDDTWGLPVPAKCPHVCEEDSDEDWYGFEDDLNTPNFSNIGKREKS